MINSRFIGSAFILAAVTCIFAIPIQQLHDETMGLNEGMYASPELAEALARSYAALEWAQRNGNTINADIQERNLDQIGGGNLLRSLQGQQARFLRNLDSIGGGSGRIQNPRDDSHAGHLRQPSRLAFERDSDLRRKSGWPNTINGVEVYEGSLKRNIDEIDRTGFDNFVKRNFDEIDRSGWDSFVKRRIANAYFSGRQH